MQAGHGVARVGLVAVEEVLGVEQGLAALGCDVGERFLYVLNVFVEGAAERLLDVVVVGLADEADRRRAGVEDRGEDVVVLGRPAGSLGHAEGAERRGSLWRIFEKRAVRRVRAGPATLDIVDAETVERLGDPGLFGRRELHPLGLLTVAEGGVVEPEPLAGHWSDPRLLYVFVHFETRLCTFPYRTRAGLYVRSCGEAGNARCLIRPRPARVTGVSGNGLEAAQYPRFEPRCRAESQAQAPTLPRRGRPARAAPDPPSGRARGDVGCRSAVVRGLGDKAPTTGPRQAPSQGRARPSALGLSEVIA